MNRQRPFSRYAWCGMAKPFAAALVICLSAILMPSPVISFAGSSPTPSEQWILTQARQAMTAQKYTEVQEMLLHFLSGKRDKTHYLIFFTLGNASALAGRRNEALSYYEEAIARYDADADLWLNRGKVAYDLKQFGKAGDSFHKAYILTAEEKPDLLYQTAVCRIRDGRPEEALSCLERICSTDVKEIRTDWCEALLDVYGKLGKHEDAMTVLRQLLARGGDHPRWLKRMTQLYIEDRVYDKAAAAYELYLNLTEAGREDVLRLGNLYRLGGVPLKAAVQYERILQWDSSFDDYERVVSTYLAAHRSDKAAEVLIRAIEKQSSAHLWHLLGSVEYNREEYRNAYDAFQHCLHLMPENGSAALYLGYCALKLHRWREAKEALTQASRFTGQRDAARRALAQIEERTGEKQRTAQKITRVFH